MKTIRRDLLLKLVKAGKVVSTGSYHFDDQYGEDRRKTEIPCRFADSYGDNKEGFCNLHDHDFTTKSGCAYDAGNGIIHLRVHSNCSYDLRLVDGAQLKPVTPAMFHKTPAQRVGAITAEAIKSFAALLESAQKQRLREENCACETNMRNCETKIKMGRDFAKVDVGGSGKYMIDLETGIIYGIKGYGVVHRGYTFGTLDTISQYDWRGYRACKLANPPPLPVISASVVPVTPPIEAKAAIVPDGVTAKTVSLADDVRTVLLNATIDGCNLKLNGQLPRALYVKVAEAIEAAGGHWNRKAGCHVFPRPVSESLNIDAETVEVLNVQKTFQAFNTPQELADRMAETADLMAGEKVLEPSAGTGNLIGACVPLGIFRTDITAVEINPQLAAALKAKYINTICGDFLAQNGNLGKFDKIIMNPPFADGADIKHILHARTFLAPGGRIVAICANGPRQQEALKPLASSWEALPAWTFKESGTMVNAALLTIEG